MTFALWKAWNNEILPERRFPPPWSVEETAPCFIVRDAKKQALAYVYFEHEPGRRTAANLLTARRAQKDSAAAYSAGDSGTDACHERRLRRYAKVDAEFWWEAYRCRCKITKGKRLLASAMECLDVGGSPRTIAERTIQ